MSSPDLNDSEQIPVPTTPPPRRARRLIAILAGSALAVLIAGLATWGATQAPSGAHTPPPASPAAIRPVDPTRPDFGPNVTVFSPATPLDEIRSTLNTLGDQQRDAEMSENRRAVYFLPGQYGTAESPLQFEVGYYTEVAGLGASPGDVTITGAPEVHNRCLTDNGTSDCIALVNFWRTLSNLAIQVNKSGQDACQASANFWAVSQAVSMRRIDMSGGNLSLMDSCSPEPRYGSGGYIADSRFPYVISGSQQQWLIRNSDIGGWSNGAWNQVFSGVVGAPADADFPPYTTVPQTPLSREKPYLYVDDKGSYHVRVPSAHRDTTGISWGNGETPGRSISITDFFIATPRDSVDTINQALNAGRNLILTPGIYDVDKSIMLSRPDTVVLGLGHATLTAVDGAVPLTVADAVGVVVAGVTIDAGTRVSPVLLRVGEANSKAVLDPANPITLSDVYFRVGGPHIGQATTALEVNADDVLIDHAWVWRGDHGNEGFTNGVNGDTDRWQTNVGHNGVVVNGDDVTATGLFVEHFQRYNTLWNGERGRVILYQNELPYDPPTQADWTQPDGTLGYAGYTVAKDVKEHRLDGGGVYSFNQNNPSIVTANGFSVPETPGVRLHHIMTVNLSAGTIRNVVNGVGAEVTMSNPGRPSVIADYPQ